MSLGPARPGGWRGRWRGVGRAGSLRRDTERLAAARDVVRRGAAERQANAVYAAYVAVLFGAFYGVPAGQQLARWLDPAWLTRQVTPAGAWALGAAATVGLLALAWSAGSVRGPIVPDLPFVDHVVASGLDRAVALRPWWRLSLGGCVFAGLLTGVVAGTSVAFVELTGWGVLAPTAAVGAALGAAVAWAWRVGQSRGSPRPSGSDVGMPLRGLRRLTLAELRRQSAAAVVLGGAALAGDLRAARLEILPPTTRGRQLTLRPGRPIPVLVRRDLLGLRRAPGTALRGLLLTAAGAWLVDLARPADGAPVILAFLGAVLLHHGFGAWCEGLRLQGDTGGTAELLGLPPRTQAWAHLVVPVLGQLATTALVGGGLVAAGDIPVSADLWSVALLPIIAGAALAAAFRGLPPITVFAPGAGMPSLLAWLAWPQLVTVAVIGGLTLVARSPAALGGPGDALLGWLWAGALGAAVLSWGLRRQARHALAHRE